MGWPSSHESDQSKRDDAAFAEHEVAPDLKALLIAPVSKRKRRTVVKPSSGTPSGKANLIDRLERTVQQQAAQIKQLQAKLKKAEHALAAEKTHVAQVKRRENKSSDLLIQAELRRLKEEYDLTIAELKVALEAKDQELDGLRKLTMKNLFPKSG